jgi:hypothetical protein
VLLYPYPLEDSLIAIVRNTVPSTKQAPRDGLDGALAAGNMFAQRYAESGDQMRRRFGEWREAGKRIAVFGAGHLAAKFVNFFRLGPMIECVIDDNERKQALLMPGSRLPIRGSSTLATRPIDVCLLSLNPESEQKVLAKNRSFLDQGGEFLSIFASSARAVQKAPIP